MITRMRNSITGLVSEWKDEVRTFFREEFELAKTEMSEKLAYYRKHTVSIAVGGFVAYAGLIVFLGGLGALIAYAFRSGGMDPLLAGFLGLGIIGFLVIGTGAVLLLVGLKALQKETLVPERTVRTLQRLKGTEPTGDDYPAESQPENKRTSEQVEASVVASQARNADLMEELADRVSLTRARERASEEVYRHPYRWGLIAAGFGVAGSYFLRRKRARHAA